MAKRKSNWDKTHVQNISRYARLINELYRKLTQEAAAIGVSVSGFNPNKPFSFADYPQTKKRLNNLLNEMQKGVQAIVVNGIESEWTLSNNKNNELAKRVFRDNVGKLSQAQYRKYFSTNDTAREAFITRKTAGLTISDRVWKYTNQFKEEIELGLDIGIRNGLSAQDIARDLRQYLQQPDKLFRRVRDEHGQLRLSKAAKAYSSGQGIYRSSYKNALRLARTETNIAYHAADNERWRQFDFVVGIEIRLSNNHPVYDICDELAGKYRKDFKFTVWHPQCRCFAIPILKTPEELTKDNQQFLEGKDVVTKSVNEITDVPENFKMWVRDNEERIAVANNKGTLPLFLKENRSAWKDYTSIEVINQQIIGKTTRYANVLNKKSESIADKFDAIVTPINTKSENRIIEKAISDYHGDVFQVNDIVRNTFIAPANKIPTLISEIEKQFNVLEYNPQSTSMGYTGNLFKIWIRDGVKGEIQINTPQMIYAKEKKAEQFLGSKLFNEIKTKSGLPHGLGHRYYEEYRVLSATERQAGKGKELIEKSKAYYEKLRSVSLNL